MESTISNNQPENFRYKLEEFLKNEDDSLISELFEYHELKNYCYLELNKTKNYLERKSLRDKNRYSDIIPYDDNVPKVSGKPDFYINASLIQRKGFPSET